MGKTKENKKGKYGFILVIIVLLIGVLIFINYKRIRALNNLNRILEPTKIETNVKIPEGILMVTNEYSGDIESFKVVLKSLDDFVYNVVPRYVKETRNASDDNLKTFYEINKDVIAMECGLDTFEDYNKLVKELSKIKGDELKVKDYYIETTSIDVKYNRVEAILVIQCEGEENLEVRISLNSITKVEYSPIIYKAK